MEARQSKYFVCRCFFTRNYFLSQFGLHVEYHGRKAFFENYKAVLGQHGCSSEEDLEDVVSQLEKEYQRRKELGSSAMERKKLITLSYKPLYQNVYKLQESFLAPEFLDLVSYCRNDKVTVEGVMSKIRKHKASRVYSFPVFTAEFCRYFLEEILHFEASDLPKGRPNTMNNYGVLLDELGFDDGFLTPLRKRYLTPVCRLLYPDHGGGLLDSHKAFVVSYHMDRDRDLDYHYDNAEVTLNVALSGDFEEGSLYFTEMRNVRVDESSYTEYVHQPSHGVLHRGQHRHGAIPITDGERHNLIIWMRSSAIRNKLCPMCDRRPELVETIGYGDGFTQSSHCVDVCNIG